MRITQLALTNFRSFKEKQTIEFAPVTLLFGPNSVGKSTVLMALFYIQQILSKGQCDPQYIDALGKKFVGGFKNLVHGKDLNNEITIGIEFTKGGSIGSSYYKLMDLELEEAGFYLDSPATQAEKIYVAIEIKWSKQENTAYVSSLGIGLDEEPVVVITCNSGLKQPHISWINYRHPLLVEAGAVQNSEQMVDLISPLQIFCDEESLAANIGIKARNGCLPELGRPLQTNISQSTSIENEVYNEILSDLIVAPLDNLHSLLKSSLCIGPLRHIPDGQYQPNPYPQQEDWYDGKACWDTLSKKHTLVFQVNDWIGSSDKLGLGLQVVYKINDGVNRLVLGKAPNELSDVYAIKDALGDRFYASISKEPLSSERTSQEMHIEVGPNSSGKYAKSRDYILRFDIPDFYLGEGFSTTLGEETFNIKTDYYLSGERVKETSIALWDLNNQVEVNLSDVGVGVSQLLPLVTATALDNKGLVACEQPELHVHPKVQVAIGDLLTQAGKDASFLIETHSEHLVLRLLRRIRETSEGKLPIGFAPVKPSDVSVVFLENDSRGVQASRLPITSDGDFKSDWPGGFFEERDEELF